MRKLISNFLDSKARASLLKESSVSIHPTAKVAFRKISYRAGCKLDIGEGSIVEGSLAFEREGVSILIGRNTFIGNSILASAERIEVGDDVLISWGCNIVDHNSHSVSWGKRKQDVRGWYQGTKDWTDVPMEPVKIGNKSWIGLNAVILKGVEIGEGAVVGAGSVVTKSVLPWTIVAGNPARVIREIPNEER
jgi:acetyltransferase-like isoleucine patch superfamily enzyme